MTGDGDPGRIDWVAFAAFVFFAAGFVFCVIGHASGFYPAVTGPCIVAAVAGMAGVIAWLHVRGDR